MRVPSGATNAYILGESERVLIDPAVQDPELDRILDNRVEHLAVTHFHPDHVGAVQHYAQELDVTVWALETYADAFASATGIAADHHFVADDTLSIAGGIEILATPGHAREHVSFVFASGIVSGDLALLEGSVAIAPPEGDMSSYLESLRAMIDYGPDRLYPGHGPIIDDPRAVCERIIRHRLRREQQILEAVVAGEQTVESIVETTYNKDLTGVYDLAMATVRAHLDKLSSEGKVEFIDDRVVPP